MTVLKKPEHGAIVSMMYEHQVRFSEHCEVYSASNDPMKFIAPVHLPADMPAPICFEWETDDETQHFQLASDPDFSSIIFDTANCTSCEVYNLYLNTTYYWRVGASEISVFRTEDRTPRMICVPGIRNMRDIGGYLSDDGRRVRQGMIYRGSEISLIKGDVASAETQRVFCEELGIRVDLDFRYVSDATAGLNIWNDRVRYEFRPTNPYDVFIRDQEHSVKLFRLLLDKNNYPLYFHCALGADRTGSFACLLLSLLGVDEEMITRDYEWTTLVFQRYRASTDWKNLLESLKKYGSTMKEAAYNYLKDGGVTDEEFECFRSIMLED